MRRSRCIARLEKSTQIPVSAPVHTPLLPDRCCLGWFLGALLDTAPNRHGQLTFGLSSFMIATIRMLVVLQKMSPSMETRPIILGLSFPFSVPQLPVLG